MQRDQLRTGIQPELVGQQPAQLLVTRQCLALPSTPVQGFHVTRTQALTQRVLGNQRGELTHRGVSPLLVVRLQSSKPLLTCSSLEPYNDSLTMAQARLPDVMLGLELDGRPLSRPHGAPARVVIPEMYGYKGVKWLSRIELLASQPTGYWEGLGYDQNAWVGRSNGYH